MQNVRRDEFNVRALLSDGTVLQCVLNSVADPVHFFGSGSDFKNTDPDPT